MKDEFLLVSEVFYSLQGEGQTMGVPSVFLRLGGCNILCKSDSWTCDTIEVWQKSKKRLFKDVFDDAQLFALTRGAHLVITGGEPLVHQKRIVPFIDWFYNTFNFLPPIEVETNGTIMPSKEFASCIDYWNCSPKLANSGVPKEQRVNLEAIAEINRKDDSIFKFVVNSLDDVDAILSDYGSAVYFEKIVIMPAGETQDKLLITRPIAAAIAIEKGWRYSDRLQVTIWNLKTGV